MAKAKPGEINFASGGNGTGQHLSTELFELLAGIKMTHVPYRGAAPAYTDVMSGQTPVFFDNLASALGQIKGGSVRALAVTGKERSPLSARCSDGRRSQACRTIFMTSGSDCGRRRKRRSRSSTNFMPQIQKALADPAVKARIAADFGVPMNMPLADIEPFVKAEIAKWADVVKRAGITVQQ